MSHAFIFFTIVLQCTSLIELVRCDSLSALTPEHQRGAPKEEFFITDVAYCEQAVIFLKQAKLVQNNSQRRKEDGTLPVSAKTLFPLILIFPHTVEALKLLFQMGNFINMKWEDNLQKGPEREIVTYVSQLGFPTCSVILVGVIVSFKSIFRKEDLIHSVLG